MFLLSASQRVWNPENRNDGFWGTVGQGGGTLITSLAAGTTGVGGRQLLTEWWRKNPGAVVAGGDPHKVQDRSQASLTH